MSQNGAGQRQASFWSLPRREDAILKLRDAGERKKALRWLRIARWVYLASLALFASVFFLAKSGPDIGELNFSLLLLLILALDGERRIDQILLVELLVLPGGEKHEVP